MPKAKSSAVSLRQKRQECVWTQAAGVHCGPVSSKHAVHNNKLPFRCIIDMNAKFMAPWYIMGNRLNTTVFVPALSVVPVHLLLSDKVLVRKTDVHEQANRMCDQLQELHGILHRCSTAMENIAVTFEDQRPMPMRSKAVADFIGRAKSFADAALVHATPHIAFTAYSDWKPYAGASYACLLRILEASSESSDLSVLLTALSNFRRALQCGVSGGLVLSDMHHLNAELCRRAWDDWQESHNRVPLTLKPVILPELLAPSGDVRQSCVAVVLNRGKHVRLLTDMCREICAEFFDSEAFRALELETRSWLLRQDDHGQPCPDACRLVLECCENCLQAVVDATLPDSCLSAAWYTCAAEDVKIQLTGALIRLASLCVRQPHAAPEDVKVITESINQCASTVRDLGDLCRALQALSGFCW